jgi:hypothetical protein
LECGGLTPLWIVQREAIMTTLKLWLGTIVATFTNLGALVVFTILYAILLAIFFRFIWIREATLSQVFFTYAFMFLIPAVFFILQAAIIDRVRDQKFRWRAILVDALKFFVATIPVLLIVWLLYFLLGKLAARYPAPPLPLLPVEAGPAKPGPVHWPTLILSSLKFGLLAVALPLAAIHLWIEIAGGKVRSLFAGGKSFLGRIGSALARAFSGDAVLIYALGLLIFFVLPYVVLVPTFKIGGNKTEFTIFTFRLLLTFVLTLIGWVVTVSALTRNAMQAPEAPKETAPQVSPTPAMSESPSAS